MSRDEYQDRVITQIRAATREEVIAFQKQQVASLLDWSKKMDDACNKRLEEV